MTDRLELSVDGRPQGKQRPRFNRQTGRAYTPVETRSFEQRVQGEWYAAGRPRLGDVPLDADVLCMFARPRSHRLATGGLSAVGRRTPFPMRGDCDNLAKACLDALNGLAFRDDSQIVTLTVRKRWAGSGETEATYLTVRTVAA